jgi:hypothetical protein
MPGLPRLGARRAAGQRPDLGRCGGSVRIGAAEPAADAYFRVMAAGRVPLQAGIWPVIGSPSAREVLVFLFCYTCRNCRHLHGLLAEAMENRVASSQLPVEDQASGRGLLRLY